MVAGNIRDDAVVRSGVLAWLAARHPGGGDFALTEWHRPSIGHSNETLLVTATWTQDARPHRLEAVLRLPPLLPAFPSYDLRVQAEVQRVVAGHGLPAPAVLAVEEDPAWLGSPFLLMERVRGRVPGEIITMDEFVMAASAEQQARLQRDFLRQLARLHTVDWAASGLEKIVRGAGASLRQDVQWWADYTRWDTDDRPPAGLVEAVDWCLATAPSDDPPRSLLWGDARYGNVMCDDDRRIVAVLDFDLATIGPAEMDLAWNLALDSLLSRWTRRSVPGFLDHDAVVDSYQSLLGRELRHFAWHEIFALVRSACVNQRQARLAAKAGTAYPGPTEDDNPLVADVLRRIEKFNG
ncbi:phosphotransferase family protein [Frankia sp. AgB1.9]|uniref:phosphotransferase family protein n=1 Tax=unclassified Frankia TaxID=2632575 RepID=UPI00193294C7|nr:MULTISPECIES: phosphotransferase family protein [unclassified Frankia]MBL7486818.1 phosphotransferase family protein [Frankia sp. AgW1.1]MBL7549809.1 phosphotransferase family protein [Frankia sp. AgB1.9]MBL7622881.1 phosphotransferase family protein [Frankia sp. AgB1.8]